MENLNVSIAPMNAISKPATTRSPQVDDNVFSSELDYQVSLVLAESLLRSGLLSNDEFLKVRTLLLEKYNPSIGRLFAILS
jgi:hypothetical protein